MFIVYEDIPIRNPLENKLEFTVCNRVTQKRQSHLTAYRMDEDWLWLGEKIIVFQPVRCDFDSPFLKTVYTAHIVFKDAEK